MGGGICLRDYGVETGEYGDREFGSKELLGEPCKGISVRWGEFGRGNGTVPERIKYLHSLYMSPNTSALCCCVLVPVPPIQTTAAPRTTERRNLVDDAEQAANDAIEAITSDDDSQGIIIGSVVGGVFVLGCIVAAVWYMQKQKQQAQFPPMNQSASLASMGSMASMGSVASMGGGH